MKDFGLSLKVTVEHECHVVRLPDRMFLDDAEALVVRGRIEEIIRTQTAPRVAVSLKGVKVVTTAAWGKFMVLQQALARDGGVFALIDLDQRVLDVLQGMGLLKLFRICDSVEDLAGLDPSDEP